MTELAEQQKPANGKGGDNKTPGDKVDPSTGQQQVGQPKAGVESAESQQQTQPKGNSVDAHVSTQQLGQPDALKIVQDSQKGTSSAPGLRDVQVVGNGNQPPAKPEEKRFTQKELEKIAEAIDRAANGGFLWGAGTDKDGINEQLTRVRNPQDKELLDKIYRTKTGHGIEDELRDELSGSDLDKSLALWKGTNIDAARISVGLTEHKEWGIGARSNATVERDLRDTVSTMNSKEIEAMDQAYRKEHNGQSVHEALLKDPNLPETTRQALEIYLKGTDKRTDEDTLKLADLALRARNLDMLEESFRDATPAARKTFLDNGGKDKIRETFGTPMSTGDPELGGGETIYVENDRTKQTLDYVNKGKLDVDTKIRLNTGTINDNEEAIQLSLERMTDAERKSYANGKTLAGKPDEGLSEEQRNDREFYTRVHTALTAAGNEREVAKWEDMIAFKGGSLVTEMSKHGGIIDDGMGEVLRSIEGMSEDDWNRLKNDPQQLQRVRDVLKIDLSDAEMQRVDALLEQKLKARDYKASTGIQRSFEDAISDEVGFFNTNEDGVLESIKRMTDDEQKRYREDPEFKKKVDQLVRAGMDEGNEQKSAFALLDAITRGAKAEDDILSKLYVHADHINVDEAKVIQDLEEAFKKDPTLKERLKNDTDFRAKFEEAIHQALDPDEYERYAKPLIENGRLSFAVKAELYSGTFNDDEQAVYDAVTRGTPEDFKEILDNPVKVLPFLSDEERQVVVNIAQQNGEMRPEDKIRAAMLGAGTTEEAIHAALKDLPESKVEQIRAEYLRKYDSDMLGDTIDEMGGNDREKVVDKAGAQPVTAREGFNKTREKVYKSVDGIGRAFVDSLDGTGAITMDELNQYATGMSTYAKRFEDMPLEQRTQFKENILKARELYNKSENSAADMVVDGAIIAAGVLGAKFTGGVSLSLLAYTSFGGALFKIGVKSAIVGNDYDFASADVLADGATGAVDAATIFLGPAQAAQMLKLGARSAETAATAVIVESNGFLAATGRQLVKQGAEAKLGQRLAEEVAVAISNGAEGVDKKVFASLAKEFAANPQDAALLEGVLEEQLGKAVLQEGSNALKAQLREVGLNAFAGNVGGTSSGIIYAMTNMDESKSVADNFYQVAQAGFAGGLSGTGMAAGFTLGLKGLARGIKSFHAEAPGVLSAEAAQVAKRETANAVDGVVATAGGAALVSESGNRIVGQVAEIADDVAVSGGANGGTTKALHEGGGSAAVGEGAKTGDTTHGTTHETPTSNADAVAAPQEQPKKVFHAGDEVVAKGEQGYLAGYDGNTGEAVINFPDREHYAVQMRPFDNADGYYKPIEIDGKQYYRDEHGIVYGLMDFGDGKPKVYPKHQYRVVPADSLKEATVPKGQLKMELHAEEPKPKVTPPVEAPQIPRAAVRPEIKTYHQSNLYDGAILTLEGHEIGGNLHLAGTEVEIGRGSLGLQFEGVNKEVSSKHATVKWDPVEQMYYMEEHSMNGTFLKRAGEDSFTHLPGGKDQPYKVYLGPNDTVRLGSEQGPEIKLSVPGGESLKPPAGPKGDMDVRVFFDGKPLQINPDGELMIGRNFQSFGNESPSDILNRRVAKNHAKLKWDETEQKWQLTDLTQNSRNKDSYAGTVMMRDGGNGTYIKRENGSIDFIQGDSTFIGPNDKVHLGSPDGPELKFITNQGHREADGRVIVPRKNYDQAVKRPDGTTEISNFLYFKRLEDPHGRVIQTLSPDGARMGYEYTPDNALKKITFDDGSFAEQQGAGHWIRTSPDGTVEPFWKGEIDVESDGSLRFTDRREPPTSTIERVDGVREVVHPNGRVEYQNVRFDRELGYMNQIAQSFENPAQALRFKNMMNAFEERAAKAGLSVEERAQTFLHVRRLLTAEYGSFLTAPERSKLAEQIMHLASDPTLSQGFNNTCNVSTVERRMFTRKPSEAARLIADVVIDGKYVTATGVTVDLGRIPGVLKPDAESSRLAKAFSADGTDIQIDGKRNYASQIFESTAVNLKWATSNEYKVRPGEIVLYEKPGGPTTSKTGEELVKYSVDHNGFLKREVLKNSPHIRAGELTDIYNSIAGTAEKDFVIYHSTYHGSHPDGAFGVTNAQELQRHIEKLQKEGNMPAIIMVHTRNEPFWKDSGGGRSGGSGGWHVVNVHGVRRDARTGQMVVDFTNQWGTHVDHMGDRAIPVETLFKATMEPPEPAKPKGLLRRLFGTSDSNATPEAGGDHVAAEQPARAGVRTTDNTTAHSRDAAPDVVRNLDDAPSISSDQLVGDRDPKGGLWWPERHFDELGDEDRRVLFEMLHGKETPLSHPDFTYDFVKQAIPELEGWSENFTPQWKRVKELETFVLENDKRFKQLTDAVPDFYPSNMTEYRQLLETHYQDDYENLKLIRDFLDAREEKFQLHQRLNDNLEPRREQIEKLANNLVASFKNEDGSLVGIPEVQVELVEPQYMGSAVATYGDGVLRINKAEVLNNKSVADLLGTVYHELTHNEQQTTIIRALCDELHVGPHILDSELQPLKDLYLERTGRSVDTSYLRRVIGLRNGVPLPEQALERAHQLMDAFKLNQPVGQEWIDLGNSYRRIQRDLSRLNGQIKEPSVGYRMIMELTDVKGRERLAIRLFGSKEIPAELQPYVRMYQLSLREGGDDAWNKTVEMEARQTFQKILNARVDAINNRRRELYEGYMQFHEFDAWLAGERARRAAIAEGASYRNEKKSLWEEIDWLQ